MCLLNTERWSHSKPLFCQPNSPDFVQAPSRFTIFRWGPRCVIIFNSDMSACFSLDLAVAVEKKHISHLVGAVTFFIFTKKFSLLASLNHCCHHVPYLIHVFLKTWREPQMINKGLPWCSSVADWVCPSPEASGWPHGTEALHKLLIQHKQAPHGSYRITASDSQFS